MKIKKRLISSLGGGHVEEPIKSSKWSKGGKASTCRATPRQHDWSPTTKKSFQDLPQANDLAKEFILYYIILFVVAR
jgi:hypothetical protein